MFSRFSADLEKLSPIFSGVAGTITWLSITSFSGFPELSSFSCAPVMILVTVVAVEVEEVSVVMLVMDSEGMACTGVGRTAAMGPTI